jgi:hypothetical protein
VKRISLFIAAAISVGLCFGCRTARNVAVAPNNDCTPIYDSAIVAKKIRPDDEPMLYSTFEEPALYAMPDCIDEAYGLTWIPSFHPPVMVRVWRVGDRFFMRAKQLGSRDWRNGRVKDTNARALTAFEWRDFVNLLNRNSFWNLPSTIDEVLPNDGAAWLVDGLRAKEYHWVRRRVPNEQFAEISKHLIRLSGLETAHSLYLP